MTGRGGPGPPGSEQGHEACEHCQRQKVGNAGYIERGHVAISATARRMGRSALGSGRRGNMTLAPLNIYCICRLAAQTISHDWDRPRRGAGQPRLPGAVCPGACGRPFWATWLHAREDSVECFALRERDRPNRPSATFIREGENARPRGTRLCLLAAVERPGQGGPGARQCGQTSKHCVNEATPPGCRIAPTPGAWTRAK